MFRRSGMTNRTPPEATIQANNSIYLCQICAVEDDFEKVCCDRCLLWYHFACANVNDDVMNQDSWLCSNCVQQQTISEHSPMSTAGSSGLPPPMDQVPENHTERSPCPEGNLIDVESVNPSGSLGLPPRMDRVPESSTGVTQKSVGSTRASSHSSKNSRKGALALRRLEEERKILEFREIEAQKRERARDQEYLKIKYAILEDDQTSNLSFDDEELNQQKYESINQWADDVSISNINKSAVNEGMKVDNDINLCDHPQQNSTIINQQQTNLEVVEKTLNDMNVTQAIQLQKTNVRPVISDNSQVELPTWLTNPKVSNIDNRLPWRILPNHDMVSNSAYQLASPVVSCVTSSISQSTSNMRMSEVNAQSQSAVANDQIKSTMAGSQSVASLAAFHQPTNTSNQPTFSSRLTVGMISASRTSGTTLLPKFVSSQQIGGNQQTVRSEAVQYSASQPQNLGTSQPQKFGTIQPQNLGTSQPQNSGTSHPQNLGTSQPQNLGTSYPQYLGASQPQYLAASQPQFFGASHRQNLGNSQPQNSGTSHPQILGTSQPQNLGTSYPQYLGASQPQYLGASQSQFFGASHPQNLGNSQPQFLGASQPQSFGTSQPQKLNYSQMQVLGDGQPQLMSSSQPHYLSNRTYNIGHPKGNSQAFGLGDGQLGITSQSFNIVPQYSHQPISFGFGPSLGSSQPHVSVSSMIAPPTCHAPVYQPNVNNPMSPNTGNSMAQGAIPGRLTAEQIAARHVMPKDLPFFYGNPVQWLSFISAYENSTETCGFSDSENLGRLQKCLKGDAEAAVRSRLLHKDSVPGVMHTLRMMFGRPELIIETMIQDMHKTPPPKEDDLSSLIKFAISVQNLSATIQNLGVLEHLRNPMLINSITDKLPTQHRLNWAYHKMAIGNAHIGHLGDFLYQIADVASQVVRGPSKSNFKRSDSKDNKNKSEASKSQQFLNTQVEKTPANDNKGHSKSESKASCPACNSTKCTKLINCKKFKDATRVERWNIVKNGKICGRCFGAHKYYRCSSNQTCTVEGCKLNHHTLLHNYEISSGEGSNKSPKSSEARTTNPIEPAKSTCNCQRSKSSQRSDKFRIVPVILNYKDKSVRDYAYMDDGSNITTMEESLADELELAGTAKELCVDWAFGKTHSTMDSRIVSFNISGDYDNAPRFKINNVRTVNNLHLPSQSITSNWIGQYSHLKKIPIATYESIKPRLLVGLQHSKLTVSLETIEGSENEPIVCLTRLGWVVQGPTYEADNSSNKKSFSLNMCECQSNDNELHQLVKDYFALEQIGMKIPETILESKEIQRAKAILDSTTIKKNDRYETGLLWKHDDVELPGSYNMALKRLICLESKMAKNPELKLNLCSQIEQFVKKGYIRKLSKDEIENCKHRVWYLPTFPVFNPKKPEKVRLVWDGAAKSNNTSLNSHLLAGPDGLVPLPELLRRFRERKIGVTGDIEEMYHQIKVQESDQHVQRFLWREDATKEPDIYIMMVMTFGSKCSPSAAQYVKNKNAREFQEEFPRAAEAVIENHYVDDMIDCTDTVDEAEQLVKEVKTIHKSGGFNIRNFSSNSSEFLQRIGENMVPESKNLNIGKELGTERVLGMFWNQVTDTFTYSLKFTGINERMISGEYCPTKREVLKILMSVFDPLGLIANFLVYGKILLQEIWRSKIEWDEKITAAIHKKWIQWIRELPNAEKLQIPRWYSTKLSSKSIKSIQLHTFVDASVEACAATTYLRIEDDEGVDCCLAGAKTKVAPTKPMSVPRLELQAAVIGTRLAENVKKSQRLSIQKQCFWSDSRTVLAWINSETRRYNQFVAFRVGEILESTEPNQWRWVSTKENVADEATKSKTIPKIATNSRWFRAPQFLYDDEKVWHNEGSDFVTEEELRPCFIISMREVQSEKLIDLHRFSQWNRLVRTQAYVLRFVHNLKTKKQERRTGLLSQDELVRAENCLYQRAQLDAFLDEILILKHNEKVPVKDQKQFEKSSELRTLSPYLDENNVLRMKGRIDAARVISPDGKRPIILPRRHRVTMLVVDWYHRRYKHLNHQTALNEIRQKYVIPALRVVMKGIRSSCQRCKNSSAMPMIPEMAGLPPSRLAAFTRPFTFTGVDYFGPYSVKVNRISVKRYGVLFTCMTVRAIHLEVADSLDTSSCIKAIRRFAARKGEPREYFSDNGTNFHGTDNQLKEEFAKLNQELIQREFTSTEQKWTFNPPTASHMGGAWERLIQTVKNCLDQMLTTKTPTQEMLVTLMAEVENIVNSRPLTYVSLESMDDEALTPNHFLFGSSNALKPIGDTTRHNLLRNDWRAIQEMLNHFWNRFVLEYMPDLLKRTKWFKQVEPIKVGDIVLVIDNRNPRNTWPKGIVEEVFPDRHGRIRHVMVRFGNRTLPRPVSKLVVLDVEPHNNDNKVELSLMGPVNGGRNVVQRTNDGNTETTERHSATILPDVDQVDN